MLPIYTDSKLRVDPRKSDLATQDALFLNPNESINNKYSRWLVACKFMIAANWQVPGCRIPENMHFYVDDQQNLCALVWDVHDQSTRGIVQHCHQIETADVRKYRHLGMERENATKSQKSDTSEQKEKEIEHAMVYIVRIPMFYYHRHLDGSFYKVCCRAAGHLYGRHHYGHPLFHILFKNIANFDSFQLTVPMVPLRGSLHAMLCQFGLGVDAQDRTKEMRMSEREFTAFLGLYDCWKEMCRRTECRKMVYKCADSHSDVLGVIMQLAGLDVMDDHDVVTWCDTFQSTSTAYKQYKEELRGQTTIMEEMAEMAEMTTICEVRRH